MRLKACPCRTCALFDPQEGIGWEDTGNGHVVYCEDGKTRFVNIEEGCGYHQEQFMLPECEVTQ